MEMPEVVDWLLKEHGWVMLPGTLLGLFCLGLFAGMHRSSADNPPSQAPRRARRL